MRIKITIKPSDEIIPINAQHLINSFIHRCLGNNNKYHNKPSDYAVSMIMGGKLIPGTSNITINNGAYFTVSSGDFNLITKIVVGTLEHKLYKDIEVIHDGFINESNDFFNGYNFITTLSPILLKKRNKGEKYVNYTTVKSPEDFINTLTSQTIRKLSAIDPKLDVRNFKIELIPSKLNKQKLINIHGVLNYASQCHLKITTNKKIMELLYNIGLGQSCGSGFGSFYIGKNHGIYY